MKYIQFFIMFIFQHACQFANFQNRKMGMKIKPAGDLMKVSNVVQEPKLLTDTCSPAQQHMRD